MLILLTVGYLLGFLVVILALRRLTLSFAALFLYRPPKHSYGDPLLRFKVICACRNEKHSLKRLIEGLDALEYPREKLEIVLIDDNSDDGSDRLIASAAAERSHWQAILFNDQIRRGKAQALTEALTQLTSGPDDLALVLDADHTLDPRGLYRLADYFASPAVGAVALYHDVVNRERSLVSVYCYLEAAVSETVTSRGRHALKLNAMLAGVYSTRFSLLRLHQPGGWNLTDDADLAVRLSAAGSKIVFAADVKSRHFVPHTYGDYIRQHLKWAGGLYQSFWVNVRLLLFSGSGLSLPLRLEAVIANLGYLERPLMAAYVGSATLSTIVAGASTLLLSLPLLITLAAVLVQLGAALYLTKARFKLWLLSAVSLSIAVLDLLVSIQAVTMSIMGKPISWTQIRGAESVRVVEQEADR